MLRVSWDGQYGGSRPARVNLTACLGPPLGLQAVREAFLAQDALAAIVGMLAEPLARHPRMDERDAALVQLVMAFLRYALATLCTLCLLCV